MQSVSSVLEDIEAIIARAMAEVGAPAPSTPSQSSTPTNEAPWETITEVAPEEEVIQSRTDAVVVEETTSRFSSAIWYDLIQKQRVILAGVGGIGSYAAFMLGRFHINRLVIYDDDAVEFANMSGQLYGRNDIGIKKVDALGRFMSEYTETTNIVCMPERYTEESAAGPIMICGFDNMAARTLFYNKWIGFVYSLEPEQRSKCLFIDGRLAAEELQVLCIKGDDDYSISRYEKDYLFKDREADTTICSYKQTSFMANMIGSIMANLFVNFVTNQCNPLIPRDLPFFTEYSAETMYFKVVA